MGDTFLKRVSNKMVQMDSENFKFLISHNQPEINTKLSELEHLDANLLYSIDGLCQLDPNLNFPIVSPSKNYEYQECLQDFLICFDRVDPLGMSAKERINYFWVLLGFFEKYFNDRDDIKSIIFCNVPHMPWDILLFYFAKFNNIKTLFFRKTGIAGYLNIDNDFRPGKSKIEFNYSESITLSNKEDLNLININQIKDLNFTKGLKGGSWIKNNSHFKEYIKKIAAYLNLGEILTTMRVIKEGRPIVAIKSDFKTKQISTFAAYRHFSWFDFLAVHFKYQAKQRKLDSYYKSICIKSIPERPFVYVSLHLQPERSTNPEGAHFDNQALMIKIISEAIPSDWCLVIKEHPKQFKYDLRTVHARQLNFYKGILKLDNAYFIDLDIDQQLLIDKSITSATVSGSVGWESLINGKTCLLFSENWHSRCNASKYVYDVDSVKNAIDAYVKMDSKSVEQDVIDFLKKLSPSLVYGALNNNHEQFFIPDEDKALVVENMVRALLERLEV